MAIFAFVFMSSFSLVFLSRFSDAPDSITQLQSLSDGMTLVSKDGSFVLGFFTPSKSTNRYLGISYNSIPVTTVVWVANPLRNPIKDLSGMLLVNSSGSLVLLNQYSIVAFGIHVILLEKQNRKLSVKDLEL
jgi:hypothetical protein